MTKIEKMIFDLVKKGPGWITIQSLKETCPESDVTIFLILELAKAKMLVDEDWLEGTEEKYSDLSEGMFITPEGLTYEILKGYWDVKIALIHHRVTPKISKNRAGKNVGSLYIANM